MGLPKLYHIWVIKKPAGVCVIDAEVSEFDSGNISDGNLVGGLFSSYFSFSQKMFHEDISIFRTDSYQVSFHVEENYFIAILTDRKFPKIILRRIVSKFNEIVTKIHPEIMEEDFDGDLATYDEITEMIEEISELRGIKMAKYIRDKKKKAEKLEKIRELQDEIEKL